MGSSLGKSNNSLKKRSKSSQSVKVVNKRLSMLSELNPEEHSCPTVPLKKVVPPNRKHSEFVKQDNLVLAKKGSTNSVLSGSTQSSYNSAKVLSEKSLSTNATITITADSSKTPRGVNYSEIMLQRWIEQNKHLPTVDKIDIAVQEDGLSNQLAPEFSQSAYQELKKQEGIFSYSNYLKGIELKRYDGIDEKFRDQAVLRIMDLCSQKGYKQETMYLAINIFDRFMRTTFKDFSAYELPLLIVTVTIMGAKMEQPMTPSINRMIRLLPDEEREVVTKQLVIQMEGQILNRLSFDFNFLSPLVFLERFMRLSDVHTDQKVQSLAKELCQRAYGKVDFLVFKPSEIAAGALIVAVNLTKKGKHFQSGTQPSLQCWNEVIEELSGYSQGSLEQIYIAMMSLADLTLKHQSPMQQPCQGSR